VASFKYGRFFTGQQFGDTFMALIDAIAKISVIKVKYTFKSITRNAMFGQSLKSPRRNPFVKVRRNIRFQTIQFILFFTDTVFKKVHDLFLLFSWQQQRRRWERIIPGYLPGLLH